MRDSLPGVEPSGRLGQAIEVITHVDKEGPYQVPGKRHWTPDLVSRGQGTWDGMEGMSGGACGCSVAGMVITRGTAEELSCEDCIIAFVRSRLEKHD